MTLDTLLDDSPGLLGAILLDRQGNVLDTSTQHKERMMQLASFGIGLYELSERMAEDGGVGDTSEMLVQCADGNMFLHDVRGDMLLLALSNRQYPAGAVRHDISAFAQHLDLNTFQKRSSS